MYTLQQRHVTQQEASGNFIPKHQTPNPKPQSSHTPASIGIVEYRHNSMMRLAGTSPAKLLEDAAAADVCLELVFDAAVAMAGEYPVCNVTLLD